MKKIVFVFAFLLTISFQINAQWFWQNPYPTGNNLWKVCFADTNFGTAVGFNGTILNTTNGGANWKIQESGTDVILSDVFFSNKYCGTLVWI
ncbi:MAG: hypothetical protein IPI19_15030 [Ignavibacteriales bacterium]|nr:hypothetical protein [Ignavibacteriales bacterium]